MESEKLKAYVAAVISVVAAIVISVTLRPIMQQPGTPLFLAAIMFSAWYGGMGPGLLATALAALSVDYLRQTWLGSPESAPSEAIRLGLFVFTALFITLVNELHGRVLNREQLARSQAEQTSRSKDQFLAMVSHELRTPLNAVLGWSRILGAGERDNETAERARTAIKQNAESLSHLINDLLDASQTRTGNLGIEVRPVSLRPIIESAIDAIRPEVEAKGIELNPELDAASEMVLGDPNRLNHVFCNVLTNAVKFTPEGGRIEVIARRVLASSIHIIVRDTGIGIKRDAVGYVFDPFSQAGNAERFGGLGLGLVIVRHLVELHGGTVEAYSSGEGRGATFTIELPVASR